MTNFHELYERYSADVYRYAYWLSGHAMEADDLTSETFVRAWTSRSTIRTETVKAYLFTITRNLYLEGHRKAKRQEDLDPALHDPRPGPNERIESRLEFVEAQRLIRALPEADRTAFLLRIQHELPYEEISRIMNLSLSAVKVKVHRVRLKMAEARLQEET